MFLKLSLPVLAIAALTACTTTTPITLEAPGGATLSDVSRARSVTTTTTTHPDANTTVTRSSTHSTSSGASIGVGGPLGAVISAAQGGTGVLVIPAELVTRPKPPTVTDVAGRWSLREADGNVCTLTLSPDERFGRRDLSAQGCFAKPMFWATGWVLRGDKIVFSDAVNTEIATLTRAADGTYTGAGLVLYR